MASTADVVQRFIEQRRRGAKVSIDAVLDGFPDVDDRERTRTEALRTLSASARSTCGISREPEAAESLHETHDLHGMPELEGYDIIDVIGQGGMGRVYEAYQQATGRRVAVKFLLEYTSAGAEARRRFEREVELVVRLQHPHIVSILDSGILKGRYYYVMEYIEGGRLDEALVPGECDVRTGMALIKQICEAVDYAHQHGVLHRDLKPSNIFIDERKQPHILDFGLAKAIDQQSDRQLELTLSEPGQILGTLAYMSPEQSQGRVQLMSVRSDVYSLGGMCYEMLTGELPCDVSGPLNESLHNIVVQEPKRPSTMRARINADAGAIALKALEKAPENRYATAGEMAADIGRFLNNEPIMAHPPTHAVRLMRWARRNRAVATVGSIAIVLIVAITVVYFNRVIQARDRAEAERDRAVAGFNAVKEAFLSADMNTAIEGKRSVIDLIDDFAEELDVSLAEYPHFQTELRVTLGDLYITAEEYDKAHEQLGQALQRRIELHGEHHVDVAEAYHNLARALYFEGRLAESEEVYQTALALRTDLLGERHEDTIQTKHHLATVNWKLKRMDEAERLFREVLVARLEGFGENSLEVANTRNNFAFLLMSKGQDNEAETHLRASLRAMRRLQERQPLYETRTLHNLGLCLTKQKRYEEAESWYLEALREKQKLVGRDHVTVAKTLYGLAEVQLELGRLREAEGHCRRALEIRAVKLEPDHRDVTTASDLLDRILTARQAVAAGEE